MKLTTAFLISLTAIFAGTLPLDAQTSSAKTSASTASPLSFGIDVKPKLDQFFDALKHDDIEKAYAGLTAGSNIATQTKGLETLKTKTADAIKAFGEIQSYDIVDTKWMGAHLVRATCISIGESHPLRWRFYFYEGANGWKLIDIGMNAKLSEIFGEENDTMPAVTN